VDAEHLVAEIEEALGEVRPDEAGGAGDETTHAEGAGAPPPATIAGRRARRETAAVYAMDLHPVQAAASGDGGRRDAPHTPLCPRWPKRLRITARLEHLGPPC